MGVLLLFARTLERPGRALLAATVVFGAAAAVFGLSESFGVCVAALAVAGMADQVSQVARSTLIQLTTSDALRGRVGAVNMVFISASNELGAAFSGFLAAAVGSVVAVAGGGLACVATAGVVAARVPRLAAWSTQEAVRESI
jgi:MFS family permease